MERDGHAAMIGKRTRVDAKVRSVGRQIEKLGPVGNHQGQLIKA